MGAAVPTLVVELPDEGKSFVETPIQFDADKLQILVAPPVSLHKLYRPANDDELKCFSVTKGGVTVLINAKNSTWKKQE